MSVNYTQGITVTHFLNLTGDEVTGNSGKHGMNAETAKYKDKSWLLVQSSASEGYMSI